MKKSNFSRLLPCFAGAALFLLATEAHASITGTNVYETVLDLFKAKASSWQSVLTTHAEWLFWALAIMSMVWTFGMMALRKADIGEFFAEFIKFTVTTGLFLWGLEQGPTFAQDMISSMQSLASSAAGASTLTPSTIGDMGFKIFFNAVDQTSLTSPVDSACGLILGAIVMVCLELCSMNMMLLMVTTWIMAYAGIFFLGFGGAKWTSDMAINYYKAILGLTVEIFAMILLVSIGTSFVSTYNSGMDTGMNLKDLGVMLVVAVILLMLVAKIPPRLSALVSGGAAPSSGLLGAGTAMAAAGMAMGGAGMAMKAALGGASAVMAAASKASENMASGSGSFAGSGLGASGSAGGGSLASAMGGGGSSGGAGAMPDMSAAAGGGGSGESGSSGSDVGAGGAGGGEGGEGASASGGGEGGSAEAGAGAGDTSPSATGESGASGSDASAGGGGAGGAEGAKQGGKAGIAQSGIRSAAQTSALFAKDMGMNLAKGAHAVAMNSIKSKVASTAGGKMAAAISGMGKTAGTASSASAPSFGGDSVSGPADRASEVADMVAKHASTGG